MSGRATPAARRFAILGNSGAGKSTLAGRLAAAAGLVHLDLDTVAWQPGAVAVARDAILARADVARFCGGDGWVVEGCYASLVAASLAARPVLLFLDPGVEVCVAHCRARPFEPHKYASPAEQAARLDFLLDWVRGYEDREGELGRGAHRALYDRYTGVKRRLAGVPEQAGVAALLALAEGR